MTKKRDLPIEVHDHFSKANVLHKYVENDLAEAKQHAMETGQELLAAKSAIPHGGWESECERLFVGSARTARFYMQFSRDMGALPKRQASCLLMVEGTLEGAAKAARAASRPATPSKPPPEPEPDSDDELPEEPEGHEETAEDEGEVDYGKCPNCAGVKWNEDDDGVSCAKCRHPHGEPAGDVDEDRIKTQRQKTVKTIEALMRAFDDLQTMKARPVHDDAIATCKDLLAVAKGWK